MVDGQPLAVRPGRGGRAARVPALHAGDRLALRADSARRGGQPLARTDREPDVRASHRGRRRLLVGRDRFRPADNQVIVLARDPGGRFRTLPSPGPAVVEAGEALAAENGTGQRGGRRLRPRGPDRRLLRRRRSGRRRARSPSGTGRRGTASRSRCRSTPRRDSRCSASRRQAPTTHGSWRARHASAGRGLSLFERSTDGGARWRERSLGDSPFAQRVDADLGLDEVEALGDGAQPVTATTDGVWLDGRFRATADGGELHTFTLFFDRGRGPRDRVVVRRDRHLRRRRRLRPPPRRAAVDADRRRLPQLRLGRRRASARASSPTRSSPAATARRTGAPICGSTARPSSGCPGAAATSARAGRSRPSDEGWLEGPFHVTRNPEPVQTARLVAGLGARAADLDRDRAREHARRPRRAGARGRDGRHGRCATSPARAGRASSCCPPRALSCAATCAALPGPRPARAHAVGRPRRDVAVALGDGAVGARPRRPGRLRGAPDGRRVRARKRRARLRGRQGRRAAVLREGLDPGAAAGRLRLGRLHADRVRRARRRSWPAGSRAMPTCSSTTGRDGAWTRSAPRCCARCPGKQQLFAVAGLPDGGAVAAGTRRRDRCATRPARPGASPTSRCPARRSIAAAAFRDGGARARRRVGRARAVGRTGATRRSTTWAGSTRTRRVPLLPAFPLPARRLRAARDGDRLARRAALGLRGLGRRPADQVGPGARLRRRTRTAPAGRSAAGAASRTRPDSGSSATGASEQADRTRVQTAAVFRYGDAGRRAAGRSAGRPRRPAERAGAGRGRRPRRLPDGVRGPRAAGHPPGPVAGRRARRRSPRCAHSRAGPRMMLYTGGRLAPGVDARVATARDGALRVAAGLAARAGLPGRVGDRRPGRRASFRTSFASFLAPFGGGPPAPGVDSSRIPGAPPGPGARTHYAFDSIGPGGHGARDRDRQLGRVAGGKRRRTRIRSSPSAPWLAGDARRREGARHPGDRDRQPRPERPLQPAPQHRRPTATTAARMLVEGGASAYFFERPEENRAYQISGGGGGLDPRLRHRARSATARTLSDPSNPTRANSLFGDSGYLLAEVDLAQRDPFTNRAPVSVRLIPLIDDLSIQAVDGTLLRRSRPALFQGLGRRPLAGDRWRPLSRRQRRPGRAPTRTSRSRPSSAWSPAARPGSTPEYEFLSSDPGHRRLREAGPELDEPAQAAAGRRRQADQRLALGPVLRVQRRRHDGHRARRRPVVRAAGADPARQRAAAVRHAPAAAGPLPPRGRGRAARAAARRAAGRQRAAGVLRPPPPPPAAPTPPTRSPPRRPCRSPPSSRSLEPLGFLPPAPLPVAPGAAAAEPAERRLRPRVREAARGGGRAGGDAGVRPATTTRTRASRPATCSARWCSRRSPGSYDLRRPAPGRPRPRAAPAYATATNGAIEPRSRS